MAFLLLGLALGTYFNITDIPQINQEDTQGETNEFWPADMIPHPHPPQPRPKGPQDDLADYG